MIVSVSPEFHINGRPTELWINATAHTGTNRPIWNKRHLHALHAVFCIYPHYWRHPLETPPFNALGIVGPEHADRRSRPAAVMLSGVLRSSWRPNRVRAVELSVRRQLPAPCGCLCLTSTPAPGCPPSITLTPSVLCNNRTCTVSASCEMAVSWAPVHGKSLKYSLDGPSGHV